MEEVLDSDAQHSLPRASTGEDDYRLHEIPELKAFTKFSSIDREDSEASEENEDSACHTDSQLQQQQQQHQPPQSQERQKPERDSFLVQDLVSLGETAEFCSTSREKDDNQSERREEEEETERDERLAAKMKAINEESNKEPLYDSVPEDDSSPVASPPSADPGLENDDHNDHKKESPSSVEGAPVIPPKSGASYHFSSGSPMATKKATAPDPDLAGHLPVSEIGRASCRERV